MQPVSSAEGGKANWVNYKTGEKGVTFRMQADHNKGEIGIELSHRDAGIRELYFQQFGELKTILHETLGEPWKWLYQTTDEHGRMVSRIYTALENVSIFRKEDWPALISFFKPRIIALDEFWSNVKYSFEALH
jgi:hypothetical protein